MYKVVDDNIIVEERDMMYVPVMYKLWMIILCCT